MTRALLGLALSVALLGCEWVAGTDDLPTQCPDGLVARPDGRCVAPAIECPLGQVPVAGQCVTSTCGDGVVDPRKEDCELGAPGCNDACRLIGNCGDGDLDDGEACDDGNAKNGDYCSADCKTVTGNCGDGELADNETCDDGNTKDGDYCSASCALETGACGDCIVQDNEACDDGNTKDSDYCSADCKKISGRCGDGVVQGNEACDNGPAGGADCVACRDTYTGPSVSVGTNVVCGVRADHSATCSWLNEPLKSGGSVAPPSGTYRSIAAGAQFACGVLSSGSVLCWGPDASALPLNPYVLPVPVPQAPLGKFLSASLIDYGCGIRTDGTLTCFAEPANAAGSMVAPPTGEMIDVSGSCGLRPDRRLVCWGAVGTNHPTPGKAESTLGVCPFEQFSGDCGVRPTGAIECLGGSSPNELPPLGAFRLVERGDGFHCALRSDGEVVCWGPNAVTPPAGPFAQISVGRYLACGVREDGSSTCWGTPPYPLSVPSSVF